MRSSRASGLPDTFGEATILLLHPIQMGATRRHRTASPARNSAPRALRNPWPGTSQMIDSTPSGAIVDESPAGTAQLVVETHTDSQAEERCRIRSRSPSSVRAPCLSRVPRSLDLPRSGRQLR